MELLNQLDGFYKLSKVEGGIELRARGCAGAVVAAIGPDLGKIFLVFGLHGDDLFLQDPLVARAGSGRLLDDDTAKRTLLMKHEAETKTNAYWLSLLTHMQSAFVPRKVFYM
uniref:Uncharacterized protein n=1 Tax=Aegilops tauschii TaxID=37682 RepID=R7WG85_AEGTA